MQFELLGQIDELRLVARRSKIFVLHGFDDSLHVEVLVVVIEHCTFSFDGPDGFLSVWTEGTLMHALQ